MRHRAPRPPASQVLPTPGLTGALLLFAVPGTPFPATSTMGPSPALGSADSCFPRVDSIMLLEEGFQVTSVDASDKMLKYALKERWERRKEEPFDRWGAGVVGAGRDLDTSPQHWGPLP